MDKFLSSNASSTSSASGKPSQKDIVYLLCERDGEEQRDVTYNDKTRKETFLRFLYPKGTHCASKEVILMQKGKGYSNPMSHLRNCLGGLDKVMEAYEYNKARRETSIKDFF